MPRGGRVAVGLSGGVDSVVLLDLLAGLRAGHDFFLSAIHVNHGISPEAGAWAEFCRALCERYRVPLRVVTVDLSGCVGESLEAAARAARQEAYAETDADAVMLAHHRDDQAETLLLQLLRGAGPAGLAAMPARRAGRVTLLRPLLVVARAELLAYARAAGLRWVDDASNADTAFDRNFLRHEVLPLLERRFPGCAATLARAAGHQGEARQLLDQLARLDGAADSAGLDLAALARLDAARQRNLLRHFLALAGLPLPSAARLEEMLRQLLTARRDAAPAIRHAGAEIRRYRGRCRIEMAPTAGLTAQRWQGEGALDLGDGRVLRLVACVGAGISRQRLASGPVSLRGRQGGEKLRLAANRPRRSLKNLYQEAGVPPWQRQAAPLLFCGERLAWAAGIGIDSDFRAAAGEPGWLVSLDD